MPVSPVSWPPSKHPTSSRSATLCRLTQVNVEIAPLPDGSGLEVASTARTRAKTGVEMEALTAVSIAALTIYDMCKSADRAMVIGDIRLTHKSGGKSGDYSAP